MRRRLSAPVLALGLALGASACQVASPAQTTHVYSPADGVLLDAGSLEVTDLLVVSDGNGAPGVVSGLAVNTGKRPLTVDLALDAGGQRTPLSPSVEVPPGGALRLDGDPSGDSSDSTSKPVMIPKVAPRAGESLSLRVSTSTGQAASAVVPVMLPEPPYDIYRSVLDAG